MKNSALYICFHTQKKVSYSVDKSCSNIALTRSRPCRTLRRLRE